jgi:hypothetical protein
MDNRNEKREIIYEIASNGFIGTSGRNIEEKVS